MLAIRVNPSSGVPVFVARLVPVRNLTTDYLFEIVKSFMRSFMMPEIEFLVSCATILQKTYKMLLEDFDSLSVASVARLCEISKFKVFFFTLFDATHLFKNIPNYWYTEKIQY